MTGRVFVDTNVLLYRFSEVSPHKRQRADAWVEALWARSAGSISWQVIFEFYANAARKTGVAMSTARSAVEELIEWAPESPTHAAILRAWHWCDTAEINFWDALIVAAAEQAGCRWLLSEDFQAGRKFAGVTVVDPFERAPTEFELA
jgi:predicted nucleic acid-binding protein